MPALSDFITDARLDALIAAAREEDLGLAGLDATSRLMIDSSQPGRAAVVSRRPGVVAGLALMPRVVAAYDPAVRLEATAVDGAAVSPGDRLAALAGPLASILTLERVALNFLGHLSGVATHTAAFVDRVRGTGAEVVDTRKTLPGLRCLQKYAVACGGGGTHRMGLYDAVLIKDNHLAHLAGQPPEAWTAALRGVAQRARAEVPGLKFVMVEVDTLDQLDRVLPAGVDLILLDNMDPATLREAVRRRDAAAERHGRVTLEASGGVTLDTVRAIAETGVDRISVGALTHSSVNLDVGLDIET
ncbi:MAG: carboxylating nicotinate-nucleotide diphosphorylase [Planctomycetota bacterium]